MADSRCPHCGELHADDVASCPNTTKTGAAIPPVAAAAPGLPDKGVADILAEAWGLYRKHARAFIVMCAVLFVPAAVVKSCALAAIMAPGSAAAAAVAAAQAVPAGDLDAANRALQDAYQRHADAPTLARLQAEQARVRADLERRHGLAAGEAMGSFILFVLGIVGSLVAYFTYAVALPLAHGAITIAAADRVLGGAAGWREACALLFRRFAPMLTAVLPAAFITAFAFACFSALGLVAGVLFAFVAPVVLLEGLRGGAALRRSVALATSDWLRVALMIIAVGVIGWLAATIAGLLLPRWALFGSSLLGDLVMMALLPLPLLGVTLLYLDIRRRREGFDDARLRAGLEALRMS